MPLPTAWELAGLADFDGMAWFRKTVDVPAQWAGRDLVLHLGPIDNCDTTWFNGSRVGAVDVWNAPRVYRVPGRLVKAGRNVIAVRVLDTGGGGGIYGKPGDMRLERAAPPRTPSPWRVPGSTRRSTAPSPFPPSPSQSEHAHGAVQRNDCAAGPLCLARSHLVPGRVERGPGRRVCAPPDHARSSATGATASQWGTSPSSSSNWRASRTGSRTPARPPGRPCARPRSRWPAGFRRRAWLWPSTSGRRRTSIRRTSRKWAGADRRFLWSEAVVDGDTVLVSSPEVARPVAVRYARANNPACNLYNGAGLPASPFRTDAWPEAANK